MCKKFPDTKSANFPEFIHSQSFWKLSRVFKSLQSVHKLSRVYGNFPFFIGLEFFRVPRNFPGCQETFLKIAILSHVFNNHTQKLSRLQKNSIKQCLNVWEVFLTLTRWLVPSALIGLKLAHPRYGTAVFWLVLWVKKPDYLPLWLGDA